MRKHAPGRFLFIWAKTCLELERVGYRELVPDMQSSRHVPYFLCFAGALGSRQRSFGVCASRK
jgi:hypothetical protein